VGADDPPALLEHVGPRFEPVESLVRHSPPRPFTAPVSGVRFLNTEVCHAGASIVVSTRRGAGREAHAAIHYIYGFDPPSSCSAISAATVKPTCEPAQALAMEKTLVTLADIILADRLASLPRYRPQR
jgi:hypothetical protein